MWFFAKDGKFMGKIEILNSYPQNIACICMYMWQN